MAVHRKSATAANVAIVPNPSPLGVAGPEVHHTPAIPAESTSTTEAPPGIGSKVKNDNVAPVSCAYSSGTHGTEAEARSSYPLQVLARACPRVLLKSVKVQPK